MCMIIKYSIDLIYQNNNVFCKVENSTLNKSNILLQTTKKYKNNYGYGLDNIKR